VRECAQLRQLREQGPTHHWPDARHAAQQILMFALERRRLDPVGQVLVQAGQLVL
jgi:hypothetical protein